MCDSHVVSVLPTPCGRNPRRGTPDLIYHRQESTASLMVELVELVELVKLVELVEPRAGHPLPCAAPRSRALP